MKGEVSILPSCVCEFLQRPFNRFSRTPAVLLSPVDLFSRLTLALASFSLALDYNDSNHHWCCSPPLRLSSRSLNWSLEEWDLTL